MFLTCFSLLMPAFSLLSAAQLLPVLLVSLTERSPTNNPFLVLPCSSPKKTAKQSSGLLRGFGTMLEPRYIFRASAFDQ
jgi:hypothetical protein